MITTQEREELVRNAREDGKRLFQVVEGIYKFLIAVDWIMGIIGLVLGLVIIGQGNGAVAAFAAITCWVLTAIYCAGTYVFAVLTTHGAKVLVHIMESKQS
jgi:hypothetical protein